MTAAELAKELLKTPQSQVVMRVEADWIEVQGLKATGEHRNAITFSGIDQALGGVIVVLPDLE